MKLKLAFQVLNFWSLGYFLRVAFASNDYYSDTVWFLQLWQRGQRIYSTFHQIYSGKSSVPSFKKKFIWNAQTRAVMFHVLLQFIKYCTPCRIWPSSGLCCFSLGWKTPFLEGNPRKRLPKQKPISCKEFLDRSWLLVTPLQFSRIWFRCLLQNKCFPLYPWVFSVPSVTDYI